MKKGFTLLEIVVVIAVIAILMAFTIPNLGIMNQNSNVDRFADDFASIIKNCYEAANKELDYDSYSIVINNYNSIDPEFERLRLVVKYIKNSNEIKKINSSSAALNETSTANFIGGTYSLKFKKTGEILVYKNGSLINTLKKLDIEVIRKSNPSYKHEISILDTPPGTVNIK